MDDTTRKELSRIRNILTSNPRGMSISDISEEMGLNRNSVAKYLNMLLVGGHAEMRTVAAAKVYYPSRRVPISAMLDFSSDCILVLDSNLQIIQANDSLLKCMQAERDTVIGRSPRSLPPGPLSDPELQEAIGRAMQGSEQTREITAEMGGTRRHYRIKIVPTAFEEGNSGLTILLEDITDERGAQEALQQSEARYRAIVEDQTEYIARFTPEGKITFINEAYARHLGIPRSELRGRDARAIIPDDGQSGLQEKIRAVNSASPMTTWEACADTPAGEEHWHQWVVRGLFDEQGNRLEYQAVGRDITDLKRSLKEKEILLQEVHQRVNNSLQLISSLLHLQNFTIANDESRTIIQDMQNRIRALSLVYETLYQSRDLSRIDPGRYLTRAAADLLADHEGAQERIHMNVTADETTLDIEQAIACGLIITELVQNALSHAFPGGRSGEIRIAIRNAEERCVLAVSDTGVGLPGSIDIHTAESLGLSLVRALVTHQLEGEITVDRSGGTAYTITFPYPAPAGGSA
ncbi:sensor histidine kinase [Methanoculleus frigidifontis]|nr:PAS domain-containing protein [Methanoculleus sp. FWC-SCC1]